jgi:hypothetical protein
MARSEIDDIFASKGKHKTTDLPHASSSVSPEKPRISGKKRKRDSVQDTCQPFVKQKEAKPLPKKRTPPTVVDPSTRILSAKPIKGRKSKVDSRDNEELFKDSRGSGPRKLPFHTF